MKHFILLAALSCWGLVLQGQDFIMGTVSWPDGTSYDYPGSVHVVLRNPTTGSVMSMFDIEIKGGTFTPDSLYHYINPLLTFDVEVSANSDVDPRSRVTALDLVRIQKHLLGREYIDNALLAYAADVNNSQSMSALDMIEIRKLILGLYTDWPNKNTMTFFQRLSIDPPPIGTQLNSTVSFQWGGGVGSGPIIIDFWAVKTGDVY